MTSSGEQTERATRWLSTEQQRHWRAFRNGVALLMDTLGRELEDESGFSLHEYEVLVRLSEAPDRRMRMSELASGIGHSRSRLTHTIARMEAAGLVQRRTEAAYGEPSFGNGRLAAALDPVELAGNAPVPLELPESNPVSFPEPRDVLSDEQLAALGEAMAVVEHRLRETPER